METAARIRREFFVKGKSIKEIVRNLGVAEHRQEGAVVGRDGVCLRAQRAAVVELGPWTS